MPGLDRLPEICLCAQKRGANTRSFRLPQSGRLLHYKVRVSRRARFLRLEIRGHEGLTAILPYGEPSSQIEKLLAQKEKWILKHLNNLDFTPPEKFTLQDGSTIHYKGKPHLVVIRYSTRAYCAVQLRNGRLQIEVPFKEEPLLNEIVESWFRWQAKNQIEQLVSQLARRYGLHPGRISIRDQKTRWGSCSAKGNLNFNWRLLMAPIEVMRYVVIHELTHLNELNHSRKFWALLAERCPDFRKYETWLKEHGAELRRF